MNKRPFVISVGEILWDLLPSGKELGGAAANLCYHAHSIGAEALVVSRVGDDDHGSEILACLHSLGMATYGVGVDREAPTGTVSVALDAHGNPTFDIRERVAWDFIEPDQRVIEDAGRADVICFNSTGQRERKSRMAIHSLLLAAPQTALRIYDANLRQRFWSWNIVEESLRLADVLKLNDEEFLVISDFFRLTGKEEAQMRELAGRFALKVVALTKGASGSSLLLRDEYISQSANEVHVVDTVGAGDSFAAVLGLGLIANVPARNILLCASSVAEYVCSHPGAMPPLPEPLRQRLSSDLCLAGNC